MANLYRIPQYRTTTLSVPGGINNSQTTGIILADLPADLDAAVAGILALTWANPVDEDAIEYITYTSINTGTNEVQGVTRGAEGFSARAHDNQATVAWVVSKSHVNNVVDRLEGTDTNLVRDPNGNELFLTTYVSSAVNYVRVKNAATGNGPELQALGDDTNIDFILQAKGTGAYALKGTATASAEARLYEDTDNGTNYIGLKAPASVGTSKTFVLPDADGSANQVLKTDGSATLGWLTVNTSGNDGWTTDSGATWTYASATTINVADGTIFQKGDRIKLTQTTAKYFVVVGISGNVITVTGGTDYTVANAAITTQQYSHQASPLGFPASFAYSPTWSCSGSMTIAAGTVNFARFMVIGNVCNLKVSYSAFTLGGTQSTDIYATLPISSSRNVGNTANDANVANVVSGGTGPVYGQFLIKDSDPTLAAFRLASNANWTLGSTNSYIWGQLSYEF